MKTRRGRDEMYFTQILVIRERVEQDVLLFWAGGGYYASKWVEVVVAVGGSRAPKRL